MIQAIGDSDALRRALRAGGSPDAREGDAGRSALEVAIESNDVASLQHLIRAGADVSSVTSDGWTPLHMAADHEGDTNHQNQVTMDLPGVRRDG